jgi:DNA-directed RNA polymerase specialized sigma24 family protein
MHTTPASLLARLRLPGQGEAWELFVKLYTPFLIHVLVGRLHVRGQDVPDVLQEIFVKLLSTLPNFEYDSKKGRFRGYLRQVCCTRVADWRRKQPGPAAKEGELSGQEDVRGTHSSPRSGNRTTTGFWCGGPWS